MRLESIFSVAALDSFPSLMSSFFSHAPWLLPAPSLPPIVCFWHEGTVSLAAAACGSSSSLLADSLSKRGPFSVSAQAPEAGICEAVGREPLKWEVS